MTKQKNSKVLTPKRLNELYVSLRELASLRDKIAVRLATNLPSTEITSANAAAGEAVASMIRSIDEELNILCQIDTINGYGLRDNEDEDEEESSLSSSLRALKQMDN